MAASDAGAGLGGVGAIGGDCGVKIVDLGLIEADLGVLGVVVDLHRLHVRRRHLAVRALQLGVSALLYARPVRLPGLSAAPIRRRRVDLQRDLLGCVLLWLSLTRHPRNLIRRLW